MQQITDRDGLPSMVIYDIKEDAKGYIWLGTEAGICRYDGVHFQTFQVPNAQGKSFTDIQEDSQGRVYFTNFSGQLFYFWREKVSQVTLSNQVQKLGFHHYFIDAQDRIWLSGKDSVLYIINPYTQQQQTIEYLPTNATQELLPTKIFRDTHGRNWVLSQGHYFIQMDAQLNVVQTVDIKYPFYSCFTFTKDNIILSKHTQRMQRYNLKTNTWHKVLPHANTQEPLTVVTHEDKQNNLWILTNQGVYRHSEVVSKPPIFLKNKYVNRMIQDRESNYWFTTIGNGLFKMANKDILHFNAQNSALEFEQINDLEEDDQGNLFVATNGNKLFYFDTQAQKITKKYPLPQGDVECLLWAHQKLYVENGVLLVFDPKSTQIIDKLWAGNTPKSVKLYQDKYLVNASGDCGVITPLNSNLSGKSDHLFSKELYASKHRMRQLRNKRSRAAWAETHRPWFWIGYADGLYCYERYDKKTAVKAPNGQAIIALDITQGADGTLWVGTAQQGVFAIRDKQIIKQLNTKNGLVSNSCRRISKEGNLLYLGTDKGLQVYDLASQQSRTFDQADGLPSNEVRDVIVQKDKIYIATSAGLSVLDKRFNTTNTIPPLIYITGVSLRNQLLPQNTQYDLGYDQNNLTIHFTGIALRSGGKFRYKYRLQGLDPHWNYSNSTNNLARYAALPSGKYVFEVKTVNEDGIESPQAAQISIDIAYPVWEKWWFIVAMVMLALASMGAIIFFRLRAYRRKARLEKALSTAALESLKLQMNPHFIFNAMGAIQNYMITNDALNSSLYLAKFSKLMRAILSNSRQEYISLDEEIEMLENYLSLQNLRLEKGFDYEIKLDEQLETDAIAIPPMFAQPFIENAIEHGIAHLAEVGRLEIEFSWHDHTVELKITDNGIGIENSLKAKSNQIQDHTSLATAITQERIALYQQSLRKSISFEVKNLRVGTQVIFRLPYQEL